MAFGISPPWWKYYKKPWEGPWGMTCPFNWADEITKNWSMPEKIELHDCTFRDGEQCTIGAPLNKQDYIDIATAMSDWGIHRYEFMPATSEENREAAKELDKMGLKAEMWGFCRARTDDIQAAIDCGMEGVCVELGAHGYLSGTARWKPEEMRKMVLDATKLASDSGLRVVTFHVQSVATSFDELCAFIRDITDYAEGYCTVDTSGILTPEGTAFFTEMSKTIRPDLRLESHAHDMNGMGVANALTAFAHGCGALHGEMLGFTLPPLQEVAINLYQFYGVDPGIKWEKTKEVCELIAERTKNWISPGRQFIGSRIGTSQVGISDSPRLRSLMSIEERIQKGETVEAEPTRRGITTVLGLGARRKTIGKNSGRGTVLLKLYCMGIPETTPDQTVELLARLKQKHVADKSYGVSDEDFLKLYEEVVGHPAPPPEQRKIPEAVKRGFGPVWE